VVAPLVAQLSALLAPEFMVVGFAVKDVIEGAEPVPGVEFVVLVALPQPVRPAQVNRMRASTPRHALEKLRPSEPSCLRQKEMRESMSDPVVIMPHLSLLTAR
jgi:hypothetical protein